MGIAIHARRLIRRSKSEEKRILSTYKLSPTEGVVGIYLTNKTIGVNSAYLLFLRLNNQNENEHL